MHLTNIFKPPKNLEYMLFRHVVLVPKHGNKFLVWGRTVGGPHWKQVTRMKLTGLLTQTRPWEICNLHCGLNIKAEGWMKGTKWREFESLGDKKANREIAFGVQLPVERHTQKYPRWKRINSQLIHCRDPA